MDIRKMIIEDYEPVYALWKTCKGMGLNDVDDSKEGIEKYLNRNPNTCYVAEEDGKIVGVILAGHDGRRGFLHHTAVSELHRHKGIAGKLVEVALASLRAEGIRKVALVAFSENQVGNAFWEKEGFTVRDDLVYRNKVIIE